MQSSTGQYSTQAGDPAQPVQHSVMTASSFGFFLRGVSMPFERGSCFSSSGTKPGAFATSGPVAIDVDYIAGWGFCKVRLSAQRFTRRLELPMHDRPDDPTTGARRDFLKLAAALPVAVASPWALAQAPMSSALSLNR